MAQAQTTEVLIVGAGPAGIATSACLNRLGVQNIVLEREDCDASLWRKRSYDRLKLHIHKKFCELPHMPFPAKSGNYIPKSGFVKYLDAYVDYFGVKPRCCQSVQSAWFDEEAGKWRVHVKDLIWDLEVDYLAKFLVVATGENSEGVIPPVSGLDGFTGEYLHSSKYVNGKKYNGKRVLIVGSGNSGMEIAYDVACAGATTSIVARSPVHIMKKEVASLGLFMLKYFVPCRNVDKIMKLINKMTYGSLSKYGLKRPKKGPFYIKATTGQSPTIDVGTVAKIKKGEIKVIPCGISSIEGDTVKFENGTSGQFDVILFATGYRSTARDWLKGGEDLLHESGMPRNRVPYHWKGKTGLYCVGFARMGLAGVSRDAELVAQDVRKAL